MIKAILTGHSRGLGAAIASDLLERNIGVMGIARATNDTLEQRFPATLRQVRLDLSDTAAVAQWLAGMPLHSFLAGSSTVLLINNAGTVQPVGLPATLDPQAVARAVSLNVAIPLMLASAVAAATASAVDRRILHVSSGAGRHAYPGWNIYCATKAALDHHARAVALEQPSGLRICSLAPGIIDTDMQAEIRASAVEDFPLRERFDALKRNGELSAPAQTARRLVDYLLSDAFGQTAVADLRETD
jgi:benzil reductase ((S)-benzoin forming)